MPRVDDPHLVGPLLLYRRIPPFGGKTKWVNGLHPEMSKSNSQDDKDELSLRIAEETTPESTLAGHGGFGIAKITAGNFRDVCKRDGAPAIIICRCEEDTAEGHVLVVGRITDGMAKKLVRLASWLENFVPRFDPDQVVDG